MMDAPSAFRLAHPAGPDLPTIPYVDFLTEYSQLDRVSTVEGMTQLSWQGWEAKLKGEDLNALARSLCGRLAVIASACCKETGVTTSTDQLVAQIWRFLSVEELTSVDSEFDLVSDELFKKAAVRTELRKLISSREAARRIMARFTYARMLREQWATQMHRLDDIYRTWWITRQIDSTGELHSTLTRMFNIEPERFVRSALVLLSLAYETRGRIALGNGLTLRLTDNLDVTISDLQLVARRLSRTPEEYAEWHQRDVVQRATRGFYQHVPDPLLVTPLIEWETEYICPSLDSFVAAIDGTYRNALSSLPSDTRGNVFTEYGDVLEKYTESYALHALGPDRVHKMDKFESKNNERADLLLVEGDYALLIEIKRSLATDLQKSTLNVDGIVEILTKLNKAYSQCKASARRKAWRSERVLKKIEYVESIIMIDDLTISEGGILAMALYSLGPVDPRFEAVGLVAFEDMISVMGVKSTVLTMRQKWLSGHCDMPMRQYARTVQQRGASTVGDARQLLRDGSREILGVLRIGDFDATWP